MALGQMLLFKTNHQQLYIVRLVPNIAENWLYLGLKVCAFVLTLAEKESMLSGNIKPGNNQAPAPPPQHCAITGSSRETATFYVLCVTSPWSPPCLSV